MALELMCKEEKEGAWKSMPTDVAKLPENIDKYNFVVTGKTTLKQKYEGTDRQTRKQYQFPLTSSLFYIFAFYEETRLHIFFHMQSSTSAILGKSLNQMDINCLSMCEGEKRRK